MTKRADYVDVMIVAEGTYPYIRGGVSSWIHQIITRMPDVTFGICFLGSRQEEYEGLRYTLPPNVVHLEAHYMFDESRDAVAPDAPKASREVIERIAQLHEWFRTDARDVPELIFSADFYLKEATYAYFLRHRDVWAYICEQYEKHCPDVPFVDYFWTLRNMHRPIWLIAEIVAQLPECGVFHVPSTGYAGFLGAMASYRTGRKLYISEHGIYTRERKIDLLNAEWISYRKPLLLKTADEFNYIKRMWINFFTSLGVFAYRRADRIFSLFPKAKEIQRRFGAPEAKLEVLPNGVDTERLGALLAERDTAIPPVITLIGRVVSIKDIKTFIRAMKIVVAAMPDAQGWVVGPTDEDEEYAQECFQMVEALGLEAHVKFLGFQNIADILPRTGVLTLTSISEGMPLVILEGFAAGVPCVATDTGSCRDLIYGALNDEDVAIGKAGIVTSIASPEELAQGYLKLLSDHTLWKQMQQSALRRVRTFYKEEIFLSRYASYYHEALGDGGHRV